MTAISTGRTSLYDGSNERQIHAIASHKYYVSCDIKASRSASYSVILSYYWNDFDDSISVNLDNTWKKVAAVANAKSDQTDGKAAISIYCQADDNFNLKNYLIVDLTLMFGAGNEPSTVAEFEAMFPGYHAYNPGDLISNDAESLETVGFNKWDEELQQGYLNVAVGEVPTVQYHAARICFKNPIKVMPNTAYCLKTIRQDGGTYWTFRFVFLDENKKVLQESDGWHTPDADNAYIFTTPLGCYYFIVTSMYSMVSDSQATTLSPSSYNGGICINLSDPSRNGQYEPYRKSVLPLNLNKIRVISPNVWDEEWELGYIDVTNGANVEDTHRIRSKNFVPVIGGKTYYYCQLGSSQDVGPRVCFYDENKNYISEGSTTNLGVNVSFTVPSNARYMKFSPHSYYGTIYNHDICINVSNPAFNGKYFPHGILTITTGLNGVGNSYDSVEKGMLHKRRARVNLGTIAWDYAPGGSEHRFGARFDFIPGINTNIYFEYSSEQPCVISRYGTAKWSNIVDNIDKACGVGTNSLYINDSAYSDAATFQAAMDGVYLDYELANEEIYELADTIPCITQYSEYGTQRIISPQSSTPSAPFYGEWQYGIQQGDFISGLENSELMIGSSSYIISEEEFNEIFGDL